MTEKEKMLRALLYEAAFFVQLHTEEAGEMNEPVTDLDNRIAKALADTEDTGGEKCPWCGHNKSTVQISGERYCNKCDKLIEHLPPKEQDDEAAITERADIIYWPAPDLTATDIENQKLYRARFEMGARWGIEYGRRNPKEVSDD